MTNEVWVMLAQTVPPTIAPIIAALVLFRQGKQIHTLVNSRLETALKEIKMLKKTLGIVGVRARR